jgi:hypothetical protein
MIRFIRKLQVDFTNCEDRKYFVCWTSYNLTAAIVCLFGC